jgi:hypothetical protein
LLGGILGSIKVTLRVGSSPGRHSSGRLGNYLLSAGPIGSGSVFTRVLFCGCGPKGTGNLQAGLSAAEFVKLL